MTLPWVRMDCNIASHDKTLAAMGKRGGKAAMAVYMFALGWSGGQGTDGHIPRAALPMVHGTRGDARILEDVGLWIPTEDGWDIHNWAVRQELAVVTEVKRRSQQLAAFRTNCLRYHGPECGCWQATPPTPAPAMPDLRRIK